MARALKRKIVSKFFFPDVLYTISSNRLRIKTYTLINIKANKYTFINIDFIALAT
jgi:hypothetical protein